MNDKPNFRMSEDIEYSASQWLMRRDRGLTAAEQDDLSLWLAANSRHGKALSEQTWVWDELDRLAGLGVVSGAAPNPEFLRPDFKSSASRRWWWFVPVALAAAAAVAGSFSRRSAKLSADSGDNFGGTAHTAGRLSRPARDGSRDCGRV
jgi:transmembrane sensor